MSVFEDKKLICISCSKEFIFTAGEQEFYKDKGFTTQPTRCKTCRGLKRWERRQDPNLPSRRLYDIICSKCGRHAKIPFRLYDRKPIYCPDCYKPKGIEHSLPVEDR